ncbi:MAG TPA: hypothetical protein DIW27_00310 [Cytophagales bacterium]|nr:hypothetical protein [Cytophagales bacterium]
MSKELIAPLNMTSFNVKQSDENKEIIDKEIEEKITQDRWFSTDEAAEYLRIPVGTLRNMTSNGQVVHYKLGRLNRYLESDLKKLLLSQKRGV